MPKTILFGTTNPAKITQIGLALQPMGIEIRGLLEKIEVEETGDTPTANARQKALAMAKVVGEPVLATDDGLHFDGVTPEEQPGVNVRRIPGFEGRPSDQQMLEYYSALFAKYGGKITGYWEFAAALAYPDGKVYETVILTPKRFFMAEPCVERIDGFPLSSLQVDVETGKYLAQMTLLESAEWWQKSIGVLLRDFFQTIDL